MERKGAGEGVVKDGVIEGREAATERQADRNITFCIPVRFGQV